MIAVIMSVIAMCLWGIAKISNPETQKRVIDILVTNISNSSITIEKESSLEKWIDRLGDNENCPSYGLVDSNDKLSYGKLCFQYDTLLMFVKTFRKKGYFLANYAEDRELINYMNDDDFSKDLAYLIIKENPQNACHWQNTVLLKIGAPPNLAKDDYLWCDKTALNVHKSAIADTLKH